MWAALALAQPDPVDYYQRGQEKEQQGDMDGAVAAYTRAIEINPKSAALYTARGSARDHNFQAALADFNRAIELDPKYAPAYHYRGLAKVGQLDLQGAIADYDRAVELDPKYVDAFVHRAEARGSLKDAILDWTHAIELRPDDASFYHQRGDVKLSADDPKGALEDYDRAIALDPKYARYRSRAGALEALGDLEGAVADYSRFIEAAPDDEIAYMCRAELHMILHRWTNALADYRHALALSERGLEYVRLPVWLLRARLSEGEAASKELADYAAKYRGDSRDLWTFKVIDHLLGNITETELLAAAADPNSQTHGFQECEAFYYAGMKKFLAGDKPGAIDDFRKCIATRQKEYRAYQLAADELKLAGVKLSLEQPAKSKGLSPAPPGNSIDRAEPKPAATPPDSAHPDQGADLAPRALKKNKLPANVAEALHAPEKATLYSLEPQKRASPEDKQFYNYKVLGHIDLDQKQMMIAADEFQSAIAGWNGWRAECFEPRHALRVTAKNHIYDFILCYQCDQIYVNQDGEFAASLGASGSAKVLNALFGAAGIPVSKTEEEEMADARKTWLEAMPKSLRSLWTDAMWDEGGPDPLPFRAPLTKEFPDTRQRALALYAWYGSGIQRWSGTPWHETLAENLLLDIPIPELVAAAQSENMTEAQLEGAARLFGRWKFSHPGELKALPAALKKRLLDHCLKSSNEMIGKEGKEDFATP